MGIIFKNYFVTSVTTILNFKLPAPLRQGQIIRPTLNALKAMESLRSTKRLCRKKMAKSFKKLMYIWQYESKTFLIYEYIKAKWQD